ncbi:CBS domain-containing protein [Desulfonatronum lacustre]|uniref:CBS domain-containing protein n=1 Tax=Desulfonatronum lacustre TaxID=66849 RepID=UPI0004BB16AD|nr:CBS domain-containing protein [Desulfonatronum lacustre]
MPTSPKTLITAHNNADFDALAAMVAAGKLYPDAALIFPGSQEKNLRNFFIQSATYLFNFQSMKEIDTSAVERLVVVDTRQRSRVEHVRSVLDLPGLTIHLYDHHPDSEEDLPAQKSVVQPWGSTTAILIREIRDLGLSVCPDEATIMGLGIYEDTGAFTFSSTTTHDFDAASWLLAQGMDLDTISDLITRDLSAQQINLLHAMLGTAAVHDINGIEVVITEVSVDEYVGDFAVLVHKLVDMENIRVLFALARMNDRVHLIARSRRPEVDVGRICGFFGGGGHVYAASATIKDRTLSEIKEELFALLYSHINPQILVRSFMSKPAVTVPQGTTLIQATEIMTRYGLKAIPVVREDGGCVGILEHQLSDRAVGHGLGELTVDEYMQRDVAVLTPEDDLYAVMEIILGQKQRLVPVLEDGHVTAVITRTDLITIFIQESARIPEFLLPERKSERNIKSMLRSRLPEPILNLLEHAGALGQAMGVNVYAVGGFVRDILLNRPNLDIDLVVEGDGIGFAQLFSRELDGRIRMHKKFQTAVVILPDGQKVDVATARLEYYQYPTALPTVELSSIKMDLYRRDFTINALAVRLTPDNFGNLVDFFSAQKDIKEKSIRVLHSLSFVEDPTRILRAIRFEQRFHFRMDRQTERLIKNAMNLNLFQKLSGRRLFQELRLIMEEREVLACFRRMDGFTLLQVLHPLLKLTDQLETTLDEVEQVLNWYRLLYLEPTAQSWKLYFLGLASALDDAQFQILMRRLNFSDKDEASLWGMRRTLDATIHLLSQWQGRGGPVSELFFILNQLPLESVLFLMARGQKEEMRRNISLFLTQLRTQKVAVTGKDLKAMGLPPGPHYSEILRAVQAAMIDGVAPDRGSQLVLAGKLVDEYKRIAPSRSANGKIIQ